MAFRDWLEKRRLERRVRKLVDEAFSTPEILRGTSLRPRHRSRYVVLHHHVEDGLVRKIHFGILRHPRPYGFSRQHHEVVEIYEYDLAARRIRVLKGINLTRQKGLDAAD